MTVRICPVCEGAGEVRFNTSDRRDPQCDGVERCRKCNGTGVVLSVQEARHAA